MTRNNVLDLIAGGRHDVENLVNEAINKLAVSGEDKHVIVILNRARAALDLALDLHNGVGDPDAADSTTAPEAIANARSLIILAERALNVFVRGKELSTEVSELGTKKRFLQRQCKYPYLTLALSYVNDACDKAEKACKEQLGANALLTTAEDYLFTAEARMNSFVEETSFFRKVGGVAGAGLIVLVTALLLIRF